MRTLPILGILAFCSPLMAQIAAEHHGSQISVAERLPIIPWQLAGEYNNRHAIIYGQVVDTHDKHNRCNLNFHEDWQHHFSVSVNDSVYPHLSGPPKDLFKNEMVVIRGFIQGESGRPEVFVTTKEQIEIVPSTLSEQQIIELIQKKYPGALTLEQFKEIVQPKREASDTLRIGTYNVLNLFDEHDDPFRADEVMRTKPRAQLEKIAQAIRTLDADVLALQEIENRHYLESFVRVFLPDMGYEHIVHFEGNNHRGIDCALLSRVPVGPVTSYRHMQFAGPDGNMYRFQRDFLEVKLRAPDASDLSVFVVHLKSKYGGAELSEPIRQAEAGAIRRIVDDILATNPQAQFVIAGDFNDYWDSPSLAIIRGSGETALTCPSVHLDASLQITYNRKPYESMIDFIMCSPKMAGRYVDNTYKILHGSIDGSGSDHNPCVAAFHFGTERDAPTAQHDTATME